jgi:hypothetical protein
MPNTNFPLEVPINEKSIEKLRDVYKKAYTQIVSEINGATNFGVANRRAILKQVDVILADLGEDVGKFIETEIPQYYKDGADDAVAQLKSIGVNTVSGFSQVHNQAVQALVSETALSFGDSLTGVKRSARLIFNQAVKESITQELATGSIQGATNKTIGRNVKFILQEQGLDALTDKGGHTWTLDRYTDMLVRTKAVEARNTGLANRMIENGNDLFQAIIQITKRAGLGKEELFHLPDKQKK